MIAVDRLLDTNFLISRWREGRNSPAAKWLRDNADLAVGLPWIVKGEFLRGAAVDVPVGVGFHAVRKDERLLTGAKLAVTSGRITGVRSFEGKSDASG